MLRLTRIGLFAALLVSAAAARGAEREWHSYRDICEKLHLDKLHALPAAERDRVVVLLKLEPPEGSPPGTPGPSISIAAKAGRIPVQPGPDGSIDFPVTDALLAEDPKVMTTAPEGQKTRVSLNLLPRLPAGTSFTLAELMAPVAQANRLIKLQAGMLSFAAPKMNGVVLHYGKGATQRARLTAAGAEKIIAADKDGDVRITRDESLEEKGATVTLDALPASADFLE